MQDTILSLVESLDEARKDVLSRLESLTPAQRIHAYRPEAWSPLDIAEHLVRAERVIFCNLPSPGACKHTRRTLLNRLSRGSVMSILKLRLPAPVPSAAIIPSGNISLDELATMWGEDMVWLRAFVMEFHEANFETPCFRHPIVGPQTLTQALRMAIAHVGYHMPALDLRIELSDTMNTR